MRFASGAENSKDGKVMHPDLLNERVKKTQYAVRGELYLRAEELRRAGKEIIFTNGEVPVARAKLRSRSTSKIGDD